MTTQSLAILNFPKPTDVLALAKPRLSLLVIATCGGGIALAPHSLSTPRTILTILATSLLVAGANVLNCLWEKDTDGLMRRTAGRPLPAQRVSPLLALVLGVGLAAFSLPVLALGANMLTASLGAVAFVTYVFVYTPLKRKTPFALTIGAIPGAMPPLMGWTAATGSIDPAGLALFGILFFWQQPHFLAISLYLEEDYVRGGHKVFSAIHGAHLTKLYMLLMAMTLVWVTFMLVPLGVIAPWAGLLAAALGMVQALWISTGFRNHSSAWAKQFFLGTLGYMALLLVVLGLGAR